MNISRLSALREKLKAENPSSRSEAINSSPLSLYLAIYTKANYECYINYMEGAKALLRWLAPAGIPLDYEVNRYPQIEDTSYKVPRLLKGYESSEIGRLLEPYEKYNNMDLYLAANERAQRAIYLTSKELI